MSSPSIGKFNTHLEIDACLCSLYLNVYAPPDLGPGAPLYPVGVFIHGGDNYVGGSNDEKLHAWHLAGNMYN